MAPVAVPVPSEPVEEDTLDRAPLELPRLARIRQMHLAGVRGAERELDHDEHGGRGEERDQPPHRISLHARSAPAAANAAARKNAERKARVIVS